MAVQDERNQESNIYNDNFRNKYPPAQIGESTYNRAISRNLEESRLLNQQTESTYLDMYNRNRRQNYNTAMMGAPQGVTGGMLNQYEGAVSAAQMSAANQIGVQRERSMRDIQLNRMAMDRAAIQEAYQAEDRARQTQMYDMQMEQQRQAILANEDMTDDQKMRMLMAGGMDYASAAQQVQPQATTQGGFAERLAAGQVNPISPVATVASVAAGGVAAKGLAQGITSTFSPALSAKLGATLSTSIASNAVAGGITKVTASSLLIPPSGAQLTPILGKVTTTAVTSGKFAKLGSWLVAGAKTVGFANPYVLGALAAAALVTGGIALYNKRQQEKQQTDYSNMMPAMG